jgi:hypothetical protein
VTGWHVPALRGSAFLNSDFFYNDISFYLRAGLQKFYLYGHTQLHQAKAGF